MADAMRVADPVSTSPGALAGPVPAPVALPPSNTPATKGADVGALAAAAHGGQAGLDAYNQAKANLGSLQQQAVQEAQARANIIGGPEAQGFENIANQFYTRGQANLDAAQAGFNTQQAGNKAAFDKYFKSLQDNIPALNDYINTKLSQYQANKSKNYFPRDEIMGSANMEMDANKAAADKAGTDLTAATNRRDQLKSGYFSGNEKQLLQSGIQDLHSYDKQMQDKYGHIWQGVVFGDPGAEQQARQIAANSGGQGGKELNAALDQRANMVKEIQNHRDLYNRAYANEQRDLPKAEQLVAGLQDTYNKAQANTDPSTVAQNIAISRYGVSPQKAAGAFPASKFITPQSQQDVLDTQKYGAEAVGLAKKLNINGGAANVYNLMQTPEYRETVQEAMDHANSGKMTFNDAKHTIQKQYGSKYPNLTKIILDQIAGFGWKKG